MNRAPYHCGVEGTAPWVGSIDDRLFLTETRKILATDIDGEMAEPARNLCRHLLVATEPTLPKTINGSINGNITNAEGSSVSTETGTVNISLGDDCTWTLTADTYITSLKGDASCIKANGHRLFVNGKQIKVD